MASPNLRVTIDAEASKLYREIDRTQLEFKKLQRDIAGTNVELNKLDRELSASEQGVSKITPATSGASAGLTGMASSAGSLALKLGAAGGIAFAGKAAISTFMDFEEAMSGVAASSRATGDDLDKLKKAAIAAGDATTFSATESAGAIEALAKAGISTADILGGGLTGALDLAASGGLEVADAAETAASAMTQFNLSGKDMTHIADLLAAGAGKAQGSVGDLSMALNQSGQVASQTGLTLDETVGTLAAFAEAGLTGSDAGTSFKTMLLALNPTSAEAAGLMQELGITAYDAQGNFIGMAQFAENLRNALMGMGEEQRNATLKTIFGNDAIRAAAVLFKNGEQGIREWTSAVNDQGFAAEDAAKRLDNLRGDWEKLKGTLETFAIGGSESGAGGLRSFTQGLDAVIGKLNDFQNWTNENASLFGGESIWQHFFGGDEEVAKAEGNAEKVRTAAESAVAANDAWSARLQGAAESMGEAGAASDDWADKVLTATGEIKGQEEALQEQIAALNASASAILGLSDANISYEAALDAATESIAENGTTLDINTEAGRKNQGALDEIASAALRVMAQMRETGASQDELTAKNATMRQALYDAALQFFGNADAAQAYVDKLLAIPPARATTISTPGSEAAKTSILGLTAALKAMPGDKTVRVSYIEQRIAAPTPVGVLRADGGIFHADGGIIRSVAALRQSDGGVWRSSPAIVNVTGPTVNVEPPTLIREADGGALRAIPAQVFAGGSENHVAQVAPAGAWRVWAEPETGGEAYIPLSPSKRPRSESILAQVAAAFGGAYTKMAEGGFLDGSRAQSGGFAATFAPGSIVTAEPRQTAAEVVMALRAEAFRLGAV